MKKNRLSGIIGKVLKLGVLYSTLALILTVSVQIFARFMLENAPSWTEEASRFFFVYAICFAAGLALKNNYYVSLDLIYDKLSYGGKSILDVIVSIVTLVLFVIMTIFSLSFIADGNMETSPSLSIPMSVVFVSLLIMFSTISYYSFLKVRKAIKALSV